MKQQTACDTFMNILNKNELIKIIRMLLGLGPVVVGDLPKPPQDSSSKEFKENSE